MEYIIKSFDGTTGTAIVQFYTDDYPTGLFYNVDIPVVGGSYVTGTVLQEHIMSFAPHGQIQKLVAIRSVDSSGIESLVEAKAPEQLKAGKIADIHKLRSDKLQGAVVCGEYSYPCDAIFQQQLTAFLTAWDHGILAPLATVSVRTFDDQVILHTKEEVTAIAAVVLTYVQQVYKDSWLAKDNL
jgi:hypothetical protein